jgi:DNA ligase (NAD+)
MIKKEAKQRIERLKKLINHHRYLYHVLDRQEISDAALDSLKKELFDLEERYPEFVTLDSPTQRIGGKPLEKFGKVRHPQPMLSFNDAFSEKDMEDWLERISKFLSSEEKKEVDFFCELKIDGLAIELIYEKEILKIGSTRGDGTVGENVTQNSLKIKRKTRDIKRF